MDDERYRVPYDRCTKCRAILSAAISPKSDEVAKPGDLSMCLYCGHLMVFGENRKVRDLSLVEIEKLRSDEKMMREIVRMRTAIKENPAFKPPREH